MKTVLVTGSSGFLGSQVVKLAMQSGFRVIGIDRVKPKEVDSEYFEFWQLDVNNLPIQISHEIEFIVHTASSLPYGNSKNDFEANNIEAAKLISRIAKENDAFLVEIGSSSVYGRPEELPVTPLTPLRPLDAYAESKAKAEEIIQKTLPESNFCIIRPRTILGTGRAGIFSIFFSLISGNLPVPLPNSGRQIIQFVHVEDLAALSIYLGRNKINGIWPAASPAPKPLRDYLKQVSLEFHIPIRYIPIQPIIFKVLGGLAYKLKITKFTPWHFGAFPYGNFVDDNWKPEGFEYMHTSSSAFEETYLSNSRAQIRVPSYIKLGKRI